MEGAWQQLLGEDDSSSAGARMVLPARDSETEAALSSARDVLMATSATRSAFQTTSFTLDICHHAHWSDVVDAGHGWLCTNCQRLATATTCDSCGVSRHALSDYAAPGEMASITADAASCHYGRGLRFLQCREQSVQEGVGFRPGEPGYSPAS